MLDIGRTTERHIRTVNETYRAIHCRLALGATFQRHRGGVFIASSSLHLRLQASWVIADSLDLCGLFVDLHELRIKIVVVVIIEKGESLVGGGAALV